MLGLARLQHGRKWIARVFSSSPAIQALFEEKIALGKTLPNLEDNQTKLEMYALFKQATEGPCTQPKPGMFDFVGKAKWEAWTKLGSLSQDDAKKKYCDFIDALAAKSTTATITTALSTKAAASPLQTTAANGVVKLSWSAAGLDALTVNELSAAFQSAASKSDVKVIVLEPPSAFSSDNESSTKTLVETMAAFPKPIVTIVPAAASGLTVAVVSLSDFVFAHARATFEIPLGSAFPTPDALFNKMRPIHANTLLYLGEKITADTAQRYGLVSRVFTDDFQAQATIWTERLAQNGHVNGGEWTRHRI
ncbi:hypothetical protein LEN26_002996 [Aphanomyces euteiches]|nr:hypothetical protein AeMF1_003719 [Aphanomyces euteiches]KAH9158408.1 hypothetical protein LEN26_002996 [Aphanomyces euteiches]KAH9194339.1 hypothetical protein AeNC1_003695 [Aphanomyces euteiches]